MGHPGSGTGRQHRSPLCPQLGPLSQRELSRLLMGIGECWVHVVLARSRSGSVLNRASHESLS